ncbi:MAG: hypothetical protein ABW065_05845 [Solirubrobacterales bacterium]
MYPDLQRLGPQSHYLYGLSLGTILLCIALWIRAKTIGEDERGNAERRALFIGLWPPMFWLIGDALRREELRRRGGRLRRALRG